MRKTWFLLLMIFSLPFASFASVEFFALLPNPLGDDTLGEYIEIRNTGCKNVDIGGYRLYDAANKTYIIPAGTNIGSHTNITFPYRETKISLNNNGNESITLTDTTGRVIDTESYSGTQRDNVVIYLTTTDDGCSVTPRPIENNTGTTSTGTSSIGEASTGTLYSNTGTTESGSGATGTSGGQSTGTTNTGSVVLDSGSTNSETIDINSGMSSTGDTSTGTTNTAPVISNSGSTSIGTLDTTGNTSIGTVDIGTTSTGNISTGAITEQTPPSPLRYNSPLEVRSQNLFQGGIDTTNTGTTNTGTTHSGGTSTGITKDSNIQILQQSNTTILFPDIFLTRQEPTNAIFVENVWDCGTRQSCRINVTFDPIFTGGILAKNYICEVITATGTLATCNPNTLYFSADSSFSLRLTSKLVPSQSRTVSWGVRFTVAQDNSSTGGNIGISSSGFTSTGTTRSGSGASETSESVQSRAWEGQGTGVTQDLSTPTLQDSSTGVIFPQIIPTWQNYTNTSHSGDTLTCVTSPCRVNFTLDPIFTGGLLAKSYTCEIRYGTGLYTSCNPPQLYPIGTDSIEITVTHRASGQKETKILEIVQAIPIPVIANDRIAPIPGVSDTNPPIAIIEFDGKIQSYYEQISDYEFNCYTLTCSINLTADRSYDPEGGKVRWLWYYGHNDIKTTKDPGGRKYGLGDHEIWLRVVDLAGNMSEIRYRIHVLGPRDKEEKIKTKEIKDPSLRGTKQSSTTKTKKKKPKKMDFFDPPTISLQKSKFTITDDGYLCRTKTKTCSLNLTLSGAEKGILYTWIYDDGVTLTSKNPKSKSLSIGSHTIIVSAAYTGSTDVLWTQILSVRVDKITTPKKAKKPPKTERLKKPVQSLILPPASEQPSVENGIPYTTMALISGIIPVALLRRFLINKI